MISKPIYEALPYLYLACGIALVLFLENPFTFVSGIIFYWAGSRVWIMRSSYRRKNPRVRTQKSWKTWLTLPSWLYESLPFIYIAIGIGFVVALDTPLKYIPSLLLIAAGGLIWGLRAICRSELAQQATH